MALLPRRRTRVEAPDAPAGDEPEVIVRLGFPTNCPACGGRGYLDHIDVSQHSQRQHCLSCGRNWEISEDGVIDLRD